MPYFPQGIRRINKIAHNGIKEGGVIGVRPSHKDTYIQEYENYPKAVLEFNLDPYSWHPTQKPLALIAYLIRTYSNPGDTVLDNCMGSATTAVAAIRTGRNWIGYEMNTEFYNRALKRIDETMRTPTLF